MVDHPYSDLPPDRFWAPAVGRRHALDIADLWQPTFDIRRADKIVTYGSCFAQHFSRALRKRDFTWLDCEPAPENMPDDAAKALNYGVFSARTGNIYTCSLLLQWVDWALGERTPPDIFWEQDGRIYDPFRPAVEPNGFGSVPEMLASRHSTIRAFRRSILQCNVLVFTLGLTESWRDSALGVEYPLCPGTVAGTFDPACHVFENQDYPTILASLSQAINKIRRARKGQGPRVLLTVSPVPLTATMSGNHVLVATSESKSVLRAVAGQAARTITYASYFPSYEIISAPVFRGMFFEPNMRSVNPHGVEHVMAQFFAGLTKRAPALQARPSTAPSPVAPMQAAADAEALVCEEELLRVFGPQS